MSAETAPSRFETVGGPIHTIVLLLVLTGVTLLGFRAFHRLRETQNPNRLLFYTLTMAWEWIVVGYVYWGVRRHGKSMRDLIRGSWKKFTDFLLDVAIGFGFWIAALIILSIVSRALHATGMAEAGRTLAPRGLVESLCWVALSVTAGFCEETIFRGYLQRQFIAWTRSAPVGVVLSAVLFGAGHIYQGIRATVVIAVFGLMFGILAEVRRSLRPGIMVHAWQDTITGLLIRFVPKT
jgi:membrane protease YdiL (CAAX protease family)